MPEKKLDKKKLEFYKKLLLKLRDDLLHDIRNMHESTDAGGKDSGDVAGHVQHIADVATDLYDKEFSMGLASKDREILQKIEKALRRIEDGSYGFCLATGKPISQERLKAIPYVEYCLKYQEELENKKGRA